MSVDSPQLGSHQGQDLGLPLFFPPDCWHATAILHYGFHREETGETRPHKGFPCACFIKRSFLHPRVVLDGPEWLVLIKLRGSEVLEGEELRDPDPWPACGTSVPGSGTLVVSTIYFKEPHSVALTNSRGPSFMC